jgi:hypothetical protein
MSQGGQPRLKLAWGHVSNLLGVRKSDGVPEHKIPEQTLESKNNEGGQGIPKVYLRLKSCEPFTCALEPPFIERRMDFYIPRLPSNLENIPSVNMYMNVFYIPWFAELISYIYKPSTSSHFKPGLLRWRLWLGLPLTSVTLFAKIITYQDSQTETHRASRNSQFTTSWIRQIPVVLK